MTKYDLVWANLSRQAALAQIVQALESDERQQYCDATADFNGWTALHYAAADGNKMMMRMLLRAGANPKAKSTKQFYYGLEDVPKGSTPADVARICNEEAAWEEVKDTKRETTQAERDAAAAAAAAPVDIRTLTVEQIKDELRARSLPLTGKRDALVNRLQDAVDKEAADANDGEAADDTDATARKRKADETEDAATPEARAAAAGAAAETGSPKKKPRT
eukprot:m.186895 g.186895  ORF g.186895 m.186895 type:complete len:220 (-) comp10537_c0_seq1:157-816(-)